MVNKDEYYALPSERRIRFFWGTFHNLGDSNAATA